MTPRSTNLYSGHSGAGFNLLMTIDCNAVLTLLEHYKSDNLQLGLTKFEKLMTDNVSAWHKRNYEDFHSEGVPPFVRYVTPGNYRFNNAHEMIEKLVKPAYGKMMKANSSKPRRSLM